MFANGKLGVDIRGLHVVVAEPRAEGSRYRLDIVEAIGSVRLAGGLSRNRLIENKGDTGPELSHRGGEGSRPCPALALGCQ